MRNALTHLLGITPRTQTIGSKLDENKGIGAGFDFLRVFLAIAVVAYHTCVVIDFKINDTRFGWFHQYWVLAVFFSLSGFLITGSAQRLALKDFLINRGIRIAPALVVEVLLSAIILGPIFTTLPLAEYFSSKELYIYLTNIIGWVHYDLPGVFKSQPSTKVNTSLWTVPFELACYVIISALIYFQLLKKCPSLVILGAISIIVAGFVVFFIGYYGYYDYLEYVPGKIINALVVDRGSRLFVSFLLGIFVFLYRYKIPYNFNLLVLSITYCIAIVLMKHEWFVWGEYSIIFPALNLIVALPLTYIMAYIGVSKIPKLPLFHRGDYSYGIYLYGFPVQQSLYAILPTKNYFIHLGISVILILLFSIFSWHIIEKPILNLRKKFSFISRQRLS